MKRSIITVIGKDRVGIIAKVCVFLSEKGVNVLDISQTIVQGYFNMMMVVDVTDTIVDYADMTKEIRDLGIEIGVEIQCQREEIFEKMHRL